MSRFAWIALGVPLLVSSCVRFELESEQETTSEAVRISSSDAVVLCPLSALAESDGQVSIVWAGYPPADDRLQLLHARVSSLGELLQAPRAIAELDGELDALDLRYGSEGLEVQMMQRGQRGVIVIESDEHELFMETHDLAADMPGVAGACQARVQTPDAALRVFRGQEDGELPIFVLHESL